MQSISNLLKTAAFIGFVQISDQRDTCGSGGERDPCPYKVTTPLIIFLRNSEGSESIVTRSVSCSTASFRYPKNPESSNGPHIFPGSMRKLQSLFFYHLLSRHHSNRCSDKLHFFSRSSCILPSIKYRSRRSSQS